MKKLFLVNILILLLAAAISGCRIGGDRAPTPTPTFEVIPLPAAPTDEPTVDIVTVTPGALVAAATQTPTPTPVVPDVFTIFLDFEADTVCGGAAFTFEYEVTIEGDDISMNQLNANFISTGSYNRDTGEFTTTLPDMPGTETYTGLISAKFAGAGQTIINMTGNYGYGFDPNYCSGGTSSQDFSGETEVTP